MNYTTYIAIFILVTLVIIGILAASIKLKKRKRANGTLIKEFEDFAIRNHLAIDKKQIAGKNMIGIDRLNFKLVFLVAESFPWKFHLIDMENILACSLVKERNDSTGHISRIFLHCEFEKEIIPEIKFVFFNESKDDLFQMMRSFKKASYWKKCIDIFKESANLSVKKNKKIAV